MCLVCIIVLTLLFPSCSFSLLRLRNSRNDFCKLTCFESHTVCQKAPCWINRESCGHDADMYLLKPNQRKTILHEHNKVRSEVATGNKTASNMQVLSYSKEMEFIAQCWANQCIQRHDLCKCTKRYRDIGQNLIYLPNVIEPRSTQHLITAVHTWIKEGETLEVDNPKNYIYRFENSNYTQIIWAKTKLIGCGRSVFHDGLFIVCNYAPQGNLQNRTVYKLGDPCSACKSGCNITYNGLCGSEIQKDNWIQPFYWEDHCSSFKSNIAVLCLIFPTLFYL